MNTIRFHVFRLTILDAHTTTENHVWKYYIDEDYDYGNPRISPF